MNSVYDVGSTVETGAIRIPAMPASIVASIQLPAPMRFAERPIERRAALVLGARPRREPEAREAVDGREHRGEHDTMPANHSRSDGTVMPPMASGSVGRIVGVDFAVVP